MSFLGGQPTQYGHCETDGRRIIGDQTALRAGSGRQKTQGRGFVPG